MEGQPSRLRRDRASFDAGGQGMFSGTFVRLFPRIRHDMVMDASMAVYAALTLFLVAALLSLVPWHRLSRRVRNDDGHSRAERREMQWYRGFHVYEGRRFVSRKAWKVLPSGRGKT